MLRGSFPEKTLRISTRLMESMPRSASIPASSRNMSAGYPVRSLATRTPTPAECRRAGRKPALASDTGHRLRRADGQGRRKILRDAFPAAPCLQRCPFEIRHHTAGKASRRILRRPCRSARREPVPVSDATPASGQPFDIQAELVRVASERTGISGRHIAAGRRDGGRPRHRSIKRVEIRVSFREDCPQHGGAARRSHGKARTRANSARDRGQNPRSIVRRGARRGARPARPRGAVARCLFCRLALKRNTRTPGRAPALPPPRLRDHRRRDRSGQAPGGFACPPRRKAVLLRHASSRRPRGRCIATDVTNQNPWRMRCGISAVMYGPIGRSCT